MMQEDYLLQPGERNLIENMSRTSQGFVPTWWEMQRFHRLLTAGMIVPTTNNRFTATKKGRDAARTDRWLDRYGCARYQYRDGLKIVTAVHASAVDDRMIQYRLPRSQWYWTTTITLTWTDGKQYMPCGVGSTPEAAMKDALDKARRYFKCS